MAEFRDRAVLPLLVLLAVGCGPADLPVATRDDATREDARNVRLVGHTDLNGLGNGGEGLDLVQYPDGRRVLFHAHTAAPTCVTAVDVTDPAELAVLMQHPTVAPHVRCNSLGVSGTTLIVAQNTDEPGQPFGGARIYDVSDPARPEELAFFDTSGGLSRGAHYVWFSDGE